MTSEETYQEDELYNKKEDTHTDTDEKTEESWEDPTAKKANNSFVKTNMFEKVAMHLVDDMHTVNYRHPHMLE